MQTVAHGVRVTYKGEAPFVGRFDGDDYEFDKGTSHIMSTDAAAHIFGYGADREGKVKSFARNGWMRDSEQFKAAQARLADFQFAEVSASFQDPIELISDAGSPVKADDGEEDDESSDPPIDKPLHDII